MRNSDGFSERSGFQTFVQEGIVLEVNETATVAVRMTIGMDARQIEVVADAPLIESASTNLAKTVAIRGIQNLPLNGRHFTQLGTLQPGEVPITPGLQQAGRSLRDGQAYAVNGQRPESNNFLIDGADNFNSVDGGFVLEPPVDAIAEFRILTGIARVLRRILLREPRRMNCMGRCGNSCVTMRLMRRVSLPKVSSR
jgi:hypothetical protein